MGREGVSSARPSFTGFRLEDIPSSVALRSTVSRITAELKGLPRGYSGDKGDPLTLAACRSVPPPHLDNLRGWTEVVPGVLLFFWSSPSGLLCLWGREKGSVNQHHFLFKYSSFKDHPAYCDSCHKMLIYHFTREGP